MDSFIQPCFCDTLVISKNVLGQKPKLDMFFVYTLKIEVKPPILGLQEKLRLFNAASNIASSEMPQIHCV